MLLLMLLMLMMLLLMLFMLMLKMLMLMFFFVGDHYVCSSVAHTRLIILTIAASRLLCSWFAL